MAEIQFNEIYESMSPTVQNTYDGAFMGQSFADQYDPAKRSVDAQGMVSDTNPNTLTQKEGYNQMVAAYEQDQASKSKNKGFFSGLISSADAAMPDQTYGLQTNTMGGMTLNEDGTISYNTQTPQNLGFRSMVDMAADTENFDNQFNNNFADYNMSGPLRGPNTMRGSVIGPDMSIRDYQSPMGTDVIGMDEMNTYGQVPVENQFNIHGVHPSAFDPYGNKQMELEKDDVLSGAALQSPKGLAALFQNRNPLGMLTGAFNAMRTGNPFGMVMSGLGSLAKQLRGVNPRTGKVNTQAQYEQQRSERQEQNRTNSMIDRISRGKSTRSDPRDAGATKSQKDAISAAIQDRARSQQGGGGDTGGKSIVCTAMYQTTGLKDWSKAMKVWYIYQKKHLTDTHQEGYHWLFKPFVKVMKKSKIIEALGAHVAKHRTQELKHILFNAKSDKLGKVYNAILEPLCYVAGKIKSTLFTRRG